VYRFSYQLGIKDLCKHFLQKTTIRKFQCRIFLQKEIEMDETLKEMFEANNGHIETKVLKKRSEFYQLKEMVKSGSVTSIKCGLY
jgi:hypothetical protein